MTDTIFQTYIRPDEFQSAIFKLKLSRCVDGRVIGVMSYHDVEEKEDRAFFNAVTMKLTGKSLEELGYMVALTSKHEQKSVALAPASTGRDIIIQRDYDSKDVNQTLQSFSDTLKGMKEGFAASI